MFFSETLHFLHLVLHLWACLSHLVSSEKPYNQLVTATVSPLSVSACFMHCVSLLSFFTPSSFSLPPPQAISDVLSLSLFHTCLLVFILLSPSYSFHLASFHFHFNLHFQLSSRHFACEHLKTSLCVCSTTHRTAQTRVSLSRLTPRQLQHLINAPLSCKNLNWFHSVRDFMFL